MEAVDGDESIRKKKLKVCHQQITNQCRPLPFFLVQWILVKMFARIQIHYVCYVTENTVN